jgi:hypothetical protein
MARVGEYYVFASYPLAALMSRRFLVLSLVKRDRRCAALFQVRGRVMLCLAPAHALCALFFYRSVSLLVVERRCFTTLMGVFGYPRENAKVYSIVKLQV